jgi:8-amino-7-oxononanoate synthase
MNDVSSPLMQAPPGPYTLVDGRRYLYFVGTGYLGLQGHPDVIRAACEAARQYGVGSATTRAGFGATPPLVEVERRAAEWLGAEDSFYLPSGYVAGSVLAEALAGRFDAVLLDERSHYSLREAAPRVGCPVVQFRHGDVADLSANLQCHLGPGERPLVMSDGVFAAQGQIAPVAEYCRLLGDYPGAGLLLDDAHGLGVLGAHGRGTLEYAGIVAAPAAVSRGLEGDATPTVLYCATLSKAVGGYGGIVPGTRSFVARLKSTSHWYDGASPLPAPLAAATLRGLQLASTNAGLRTRLWENVRLAKDGLRRLGMVVDDTPVPIIGLSLGNAENMRRIQGALQDRGILVAYMAKYAGLGPEGALRLAVFANHTAAMIEELLDQLQRLV